MLNGPLHRSSFSSTHPQVHTSAGKSELGRRGSWRPAFCDTHRGRPHNSAKSRAIRLRKGPPPRRVWRAEPCLGHARCCWVLLLRARRAADQHGAILGWRGRTGSCGQAAALPPLLAAPRHLQSPPSHPSEHRTRSNSFDTHLLFTNSWVIKSGSPPCNAMARQQDVGTSRGVTTCGSTGRPLSARKL